MRSTSGAPTLRAVALLAATAGCSSGRATPPEEAALPGAVTPEAPRSATPHWAGNDGGCQGACPPATTSRCTGVRCASIERCDEATGGCVPSCPVGEVYIPSTGPAG